MRAGIRNIARLLLVFIMVSSLAGCTFTDRQTNEPSITLGQRDYDLWKSTVSEYLTNNLWTDRDAYDAGHLLMPALDAAFRSGETDWQRAFADHFERFVTAYSLHANEVTQQPLTRLQYLYLAGRYLSKASSQSDTTLMPDGLASLLLKELEFDWLDYEATQWAMPPFHGIKKRIEWKLSTSKVDKSYYRAIIDEDLFTTALAGDYRAYERNTVAVEDWSPIVTDILAVAYRMVKDESASENGGWLFQPGVWADHPDYAFAGVTVVEPGMKATPRENVATDSSHAGRWPLWFRSFRDAYDPESKEYQLFDKDLTLLAHQFVDHVLVPATDDVPYMRMTNYMDGWNGLFRWGYATTGADNGYGPNELSGSLLVMWWGLLPDTRSASAFCDLAESFPLPAEAVALYVGPNTTRERNPLAAWPNYFDNGFSELNARLMCNLGSH